ncbi:MAG TPA: FAD-binding oxidoreductase [Solirubrobacteraceae bacterium]|nr:FAD-binding oxidoreductase [Solirubrobacteraceae bacterium]
MAAAGPGSQAVPAPGVVPATLAGWGGGPRVPADVVSAPSLDALRAAVVAAPAAPSIPRGMGRSYGDAAQLAHGRVLQTTALVDFTLDASAGVLRTQAGATLGRLLAALAPAGWTLPVVPGTQHVSIGGAIAADIHGKNHGGHGTFGSHVLSLGLLTASGEVRELSPDSDPQLFGATIGGMGLTGVIVWAQVRLRRLKSPLLAVDTDRVDDLDAALAALLDAGGGPHRVAWLDLLGPGLARGVVTRADDAGEAAAANPRASEPGAAMTVAGRLRIPPRWPGGLLRPGVVRAYNEYRFRSTPRRARGELEPFGVHMFPLDVLDAWPRLYGAGGFVQYQLVVPRGEEVALEQVLVQLRRSQVPCYLAVLKDFGEANGFPLSFPLAGWTLALDLPRGAPGLEAELDRLDEIVAGAGGRIYLAKDARVRPATLAAMYPRLDEWREIRDGADPQGRWRSDLAARTGLVAGAPAGARG